MWSAWESRPRRGRELAGWMIVTAGLGALQLPAMGRMAMQGVGIVEFEMMRTTNEAIVQTAVLGRDGLAAARQQLFIDFPFLVAYGIALSGACILLRGVARRRGSTLIAKLAPVLAWAAVVAAACDAVENLALLAITYGHTGQPLPAIAAGYATAKFILLAATGAFLIVGALQVFALPVGDVADGPADETETEPG